MGFFDDLGRFSGIGMLKDPKRLLQLAKMAAPIAATAVGGPLAGIATGAAVGGGSSAAKGGGLKDIALQAAIGGGTSALGAGAGKALGGLAQEGGKLAASKGVQTAAEKGLSLGLEQELARKGTELGVGAATGAGEGLAAGAKLGLKNAPRFMEQAGNVADKAASQVRFMEHMQELGGAGIDAAAEAGDRKKQAAALRQQANFARMSSVPQGQQYGVEPWVPGHLR